jgi:hypothetical protein
VSGRHANRSEGGKEGGEGGNSTYRGFQYLI